MRIAIDPGQSGAIAWQAHDGSVGVKNMPETPRDIYDFLLSLKSEDCRCFIEQVGAYFSGNSAPAAVKFARHCGQLDGFLIALEIPFFEIQPAKWEHHFIGKPNWPKIPKEITGIARRRILSQRKRERKNKIKVRAQAVYPHLKVTLTNADALGLLYYATLFSS